MPRWHHSDSSSERYQEVKSIKTFYAAHISRSKAKSMFGNWTIWRYACVLDIILRLIFDTFSEFGLSRFSGIYTMKVNGHWVPCVHNSSHSFILILFRCPDHELKICMWFEYNPQINV